MHHLIIYAPNVGGGGGLVLLQDLLKAHWPASVTAILDRRGYSPEYEFNPAVQVHWADSSVLGRWRAERLLARLAGPDELVLCFHNLPPILPIRGKAYCFVQNANLVGIIPRSHLSGWLRIRYAVERLIARSFRFRIRRYIVQTQTMAEALRQWYGSAAPPIHIFPLVPKSSQVGTVSRPFTPTEHKVGGSARKWDFLYVSDGHFHKNHRRLFAAWRLLAGQGVFPSLALTLHPGRDAVLQRTVSKLSAEGLRIEDLGQLPHRDVIAAFQDARAMIFPSYAESFGIPLAEARAAGLPILAPELDYVRDVCEPVATFDATSPRSIARAVLRFLGHAPDTASPMSTEGFVRAIAELSALDKS